MADYDCIVAFDPDWKALKPEQVDLLFDWVDQDHGGMIVLAGPVNAGRTAEGWVQDPEMAKIRRLYPVEFNQGLNTRSNAMYSSEEPWPLEFTREGLQAAYLWLGDSAIASQATWAQFSGVYSFYPVRDKKAGATCWPASAIRARPRAASSRSTWPCIATARRPSCIWAAPKPGGCGGSIRPCSSSSGPSPSASWPRNISAASRRAARSRSIATATTWAASVEVRAQLKNSRLQPLASPSVTLYVTRDGIDRQAVSMPADPSRGGAFHRRIAGVAAGRIQLGVARAGDGGRAVAPDFPRRGAQLEEENPQRNAALLREIAQKTQGEYYDDLSAALSDTASPSLVDRLKDVSRTDIDSAGPQAGRRREMAEMDVGRPVLRFESGVAGSAFGETGLIVSIKEADRSVGLVGLRSDKTMRT